MNNRKLKQRHVLPVPENIIPDVFFLTINTKGQKTKMLTAPMPFQLVTPAEEPVKADDELSPDKEYIVYKDTMIAFRKGDKKFLKNFFLSRQLPPLSKIPQLALTELAELFRHQECMDIHFIRQTPVGCLSLKLLPEWRRTEPVVYEAVLLNRFNIFHAPVRSRSQRVCMQLVTHDGNYLEQVPPENRTKDICLVSLATCDPRGKALSFFPEHLLTKNHCIMAVRYNPQSLAYVPLTLRTKQICRIALQLEEGTDFPDYSLLRHVPFPDVCQEALKFYFKIWWDRPLDVFHQVRPEVINEKIARYAVSEHPGCFALLPMSFQTQPLLDLALRKGGITILREMAVPAFLETTPLIKEAIVKSRDAFLQLPTLYKTPEICLFAEQKYPRLRLQKGAIPEVVSGGVNPYTIHRMFREKCGGDLDYDLVEKLYQGYRLKFRMILFNSRKYSNVLLSFDVRKNDLVLKPVSLLARFSGWKENLTGRLETRWDKRQTESA